MGGLREMLLPQGIFGSSSGIFSHPESRTSLTYLLQRDEKSWSLDPRVFVDKGRAMPDGSPALLKTRKHLRRERAEGMWKDLVRKGWEKVPAVWGADAEL